MRERLWLGLGVALMVVGLVLGGIVYPMSHNTNNPLTQSDAITLRARGDRVRGGRCRAVLAVFGRVVPDGFGWRGLIYEQKAQTDRLLAPNSSAATPADR